MKKSDIVEILVEEFGMEKSQLEAMKYKELKDLLDKEVEEAEKRKQALLDKLKKEVKVKEDTKQQEKRRVKVTIDRDEEIPVINYFDGVFSHTGSDGVRYEFSEFGARDFIPFGELIKIKSRFPHLINDPVLYIDDPEAVEALKLTDLYKNIIHPDQLRDVLYDYEQLEKCLDKCTKGAIENIIRFAKEEFRSGRLHDARIPRLIKVKFGIDFGHI